MVTVNNASRYGRIEKGDRIPYGTLADASYELRKAYYYEGYPKDTDFPELPIWEPVPVEVNVAQQIFLLELHDVLAAIFEEYLTPREAKVISMRFGIDCEEMTLEEVGGAFDLSRERIRQIEAKAIRKLKHPRRCPEVRALHGFLFEC